MYANRRRIRGARGKRLQARRGERVERNFAHQFDTGGMDRLYVRGRNSVHKKLLIQADSYIPRPGAPPLPAPSPYTINLVDNVTRQKLDVARVVHIHGGVSPYSDLVAAAGRQ